MEQSTEDFLRRETMRRLASGLDVPPYLIGPAQPRRTIRLLAALNTRWGKRLVPDEVYYWLLDRLTDNNGWRPLSYRQKRGLR